MHFVSILLLASPGALFGPEGGETAPVATEEAVTEEAAVEPATEPAPAAELEGEVHVGNKDHDFGPFYEAEPVSEVRYPSERRSRQPWLSVGKGTFCFVEDAVCKASLLVAADVAAGLNVISGDGGFDVPLTQYRILGGFSVRPFRLARKQWHPWALGATFDWSRASGPVAAGEVDEAGNVLADEDRKHIPSIRIMLLNQIWMSQRKHAFHVDIKLGTVQSSVLNFPSPKGCSNPGGRCYWGTTAEVAFGFGGWGALYLASDFLDQDTRVFIGFRVHGIAAGPVAGLAVAGYAAGGGFSEGGS